MLPTARPRRGAAALLGRLMHHATVLGGASLLTLLTFLVLPLMQALSAPPATDLLVRTADVANLPPPPPPAPEEEPPPEEEPEEPPPELSDEPLPLDLSMIELALNPGFGGDGWSGADFAMTLHVATAGGDDVDELFSLAELDQEPRVVYQPGPVIDAKVRQRAPGTAYVLFVVDEQGRVQDALVQSATDPVFERPALAAVKQWRFEPGRRNGQPVRFRMRVPIIFPEG